MLVTSNPEGIQPTHSDDMKFGVKQEEWHPNESSINPIVLQRQE
jgi:hypothetical protein